MRKIGILLICMLWMNTSRAQFEIKEGKNVTYLFLTSETPGQTNESSKFSEVTIFRVNGNKSVQLGILQKAKSQKELKQIAGAEVLRFIMQLQNLSTEEEAWNYFKTHHKQSDYGLLALNVDFLVALGVCYKDDIAKRSKGSILVYKVSFLPKAAGEPKILTGEIALKGEVISPKPKVKSFKETDSILSMTWQVSQNEGQELLMANIYRKKGNYGSFKKVKQMLLMEDKAAKEFIIAYSEKVKPNSQYEFYAVPTSITGLEGTASDTLSLISSYFASIPQVVRVTAKDTTAGLYLSWDSSLQKNKFVSGIVLERSTNPKNGYVTLDTFSKQRLAYVDDQVLPNILYHYRIRFLTIRQNITVQAAHSSGIHADRSIFIEAPIGLKVSSTERNVSLSWKPSIFPEVAGYYVYRSASGQDNWSLVSNFTADTFFVDETISEGNTMFKYGIVAVGFSGNRSSLSNIEFGTIRKRSRPLAPIGLQTTLINGSVFLSWKPMQIKTMANPTFRIYRAKGKIELKDTSVSQFEKRGFSRIGQSSEARFLDSNVEAGISYTYFITTVDDNGNEGNVSRVSKIHQEKETVAFPLNVGVRKIKNDVIVSWDGSQEAGVTGYVIYRRKRGEDNFAKMQTVDAQTYEYKERRLEKGSYFYYVVTALKGKQESSKGIEVGIRH